ncbi:MAG TPA: rhodanese-like domain-containing protein [Blastocatellia bacterium]|nr:rhodanese-like domain-containing protein [Blastocatellia bacterium]
MKYSKQLILIVAAGLMTGGVVAAQHNNDHASQTAAVSQTSKNHITAPDLKRRLDSGDKIIVVDARSNLAGQILKGAVQVPMSKLEEWAKTIDKGAIIVTYCTCPHDESADAEMEKLKAWGFQNALSLSGGLEAARTAGIEIIKPAE